MKNISKLFKNIKQTVAKNVDPFQNTDATSTFFKKVQASDARNNRKYGDSNVIVEDRIPQLDRVVLRGNDKTRAIVKIEELVYRANFQNISDELKDACEIVHYHLMNDLPIRVSLVKQVLPDLEFNNEQIVDENNYEEWLKHKHHRGGDDAEIEIEDTYSMNVEGQRGKKAPEDWNAGGGTGNSWNKKNK